jgi:toxin ParE1/3/4
MSRYRLAEVARDDVAEIYKRVAADNPPAAKRLLSAFFTAFRMLAKSPGIGTSRPDYRGGNMRTFSVRRYVIVFRRVDDVVEIARVLHAARDLDNLLG